MSETATPDLNERLNGAWKFGIVLGIWLTIVFYHVGWWFQSQAYGAVMMLILGVVMSVVFGLSKVTE